MIRAYELRIRGLSAGHACEGETAERAARAWVAENGLAEGLIVDARDEDGRVVTLVSVGNDVARRPGGQATARARCFPLHAGRASGTLGSP